MSSGADTPYDITAIPYFAWSPGPLAWACLLAGSAVVFFLVRYILARTGKVRVMRSIDAALEELSEIRSSLSGADAADPAERARIKDRLFRASLIAKRLAGTIGGQDISHLGASELAVWSAGCANEPLKRAVEIIVKIEGYKYMPGISPAQSEELIGILTGEIENIKNAMGAQTA